MDGVYKNLIGNLWKEKHFFAQVCLLGFILSLIVILGTPKEYEASIFTVPESTAGIFDAEGMLDLGLNTDKMRVRDAILPSFYPGVVSSTPFLVSLFDIPVTLSGKEADTLTLSEYISEYQRYPWWSSILGLPRKVVGFASNLLSNEEPEDMFETGKPVNPFRLSQREAAIAGIINNRITVDVDRKRRTITLKVRMQDPYIAAVVADSVRSHLQDYITDYRTRKELRNLDHIRTIQEQAYNEYDNALKAYASFSDNNQDLANKQAQAELVKLRVEKDMTYNYYIKIANQVQLAKNRAYKERPVYAIIEPAKVPIHPVAPARINILIGFTSLSIFIGGGWIWLKSNIFLTKHKSSYSYANQRQLQSTKNRQRKSNR